MLKVVIIGYGEMFTNLIAGTLDSGAKIVGVLRQDVTKYPIAIRKIKDIINPSTEYSYIKSYNLPEIITKSVNSDNFRKQLLALNPDVVLVGSWSEKFSKQTFDIPKIATINAHPSLLPKYRGPNPYFWVIRNLEKTTGVTFHLMTEKLDRGAILAQEEIKIFPSDTGQTLKDRTVLTARGVVCELLRDLSEDIKIPLTQNEEKATYDSFPRSTELDFKKSAEDNLALIKACFPWYKPFFYHDITPLIPNAESTYIKENTTNFTDAGTVVAVNSKTKSISILCEDGKILQMDKIKLYKWYDRPFTRNYISREVKIGDIII